MYFITTKRMLEVCFSAHPNIQYRTVFIILSKCLESLDLDCERMPGIHGTGTKHSWYRTLVISGKLYYNRRNGLI